MGYSQIPRPFCLIGPLPRVKTIKKMKKKPRFGKKIRNPWFFLYYLFFFIFSQTPKQNFPPPIVFPPKVFFFKKLPLLKQSWKTAPRYTWNKPPLSKKKISYPIGLFSHRVLRNKRFSTKLGGLVPPLNRGVPPPPLLLTSSYKK